MDLEGVSVEAHRCPASALDTVPLGTAAEERARAKAWMNTAASHLRHVDWLEAELFAAKKDPLIAMLEGMSREERLNFASAQRPEFIGGLHPSTFIDELKPVIDDASAKASFEAAEHFVRTAGSIAREGGYKQDPDSVAGGGVNVEHSDLIIGGPQRPSSDLRFK